MFSLDVGNSELRAEIQCTVNTSELTFLFKAAILNLLKDQLERARTSVTKNKEKPTQTINARRSQYPNNRNPD